MKLLALVTDAFGGHGGIAQYNRDLLTALDASQHIDLVRVLPRLQLGPLNALPVKIQQDKSSSARLVYSARALLNAREFRPDIVFCGHLFMVPLASLVARASGAKLWLQTHGVEAWDAPNGHICRAARRSDLVTAVSRFTRNRMLHGWLDIAPTKVRVLPNTVSEAFAPHGSCDELRARYSLGQRKVLLTVSRISEADRYKGHDRVIRLIPRLVAQGEDIVYLVAGSGDDIPRLKDLAVTSGIEDRVQFIGSIPPEELAEHFRMADVFVMPSTKEGFGIVFLEAASCGTPVVGGCRDGSWDALREGRLGIAIDPDNSEELEMAVKTALERGRSDRAGAVDVFRRAQFNRHVDALMRELLYSFSELHDPEDDQF